MIAGTLSSADKVIIAPSDLMDGLEACLNTSFTFFCCQTDLPKE
jgi:hypothetical protein